MKCLNKVMIIGTVGRDPEMRYMPSGRPATSFCVGSTHEWTDLEGERHADTEWFNVVAWGDLAEICKKRLHKDKPVYVEGRMQTRRWENHEGEQSCRTELVAREMIVLDDCRGVANVSEPAGEVGESERHLF